MSQEIQQSQQKAEKKENKSFAEVVESIHDEAKKACIEVFKETCKGFNFRDKEFLTKLEEKLDSKKNAIAVFMKKKLKEAEDAIKAEG
jgi:hypothetical protein